MSGKMKKTIQNKKFRIASICSACALALVLIAGVAFNIFAAPAQVPYYGPVDRETGRGEYEDEYVFGRKLYTREDKFLMLEIVPCAGYGELGYMVGEDEGGVALDDIKKIQDGNVRANLLSTYKSLTYSFFDGGGGGGWNHIDDDGHIVDCEYTAEDGRKYYDRNVLARNLAGNSYLSNKFEIITITPAKLNENPGLVDRADLIYISKGPHGSSKDLYNAMANAAAAANNAELMAKYPILYTQAEYGPDNNFSKEVAWKLVQHNIINDKALIFDFASSKSEPQDYDYLSKVYELVTGIDSDVLREQFMGEMIADANGKVVRCEGSIGYFDVENFQVHFIGPDLNLGYNVPIALDKDNQWVLSANWEGWKDGVYLRVPAGTLISNHWSIEDQLLQWNASIFAAINTGIFRKTYSEYPYYNANAIPPGYMNGSVFVFNGDVSLTQAINGKVAYTDNNFPQQDVDYDQAKSLYGEDITNTEVIKYLLGVYPARTAEIDVLEIQPAGFYQFSKYDKSSFTRTVTDFQTAVDLMHYLGGDTSALTRKNYAQRVRVTSVPVNGFNAMNDVITSKYDLVIVGAQTEAVDANVVRTQGFRMNLDRVDDRLDGLIYTSVGDIFGLSLQDAYPKGDYYAGYEASGPGYTRAGGNDLTDKAYEKLVNYGQRIGMPLILAKDIYNGNKRTIGSTTNVYKLGQMAGNENVVTFEQAAMSHNFGLKDAYKEALSKKAVIEVEYPLPLEYDGDIVKNTNRVTKNMEFAGTIKGAPGCDYRYIIYIDRNGDGIYRTDNVVDDKNEIFASGTMSFDEYGNLAVSRENGDISVGDGGGASGGNHFSIKVTLPDSLVGYFRWRLEVAETESLIESDYEGDFMVASEAKSVKVLQIIPDLYESRSKEFGTETLSGGYRNAKRSAAFSDAAGTDGKSTTSPGGQTLRLLLSSAYVQADANYRDIDNLLFAARRFEELFKKAQEVTGLNLEVTTLTTTGYENLFIYNDAGNADITKKAYRGPADYEDYNRNPLLQYDMVVIGFSDSYSSDTIGNNQGAVSVLKDYSARGNAILFAHDTMMYSNYSDGHATAAYEKITYGNTNRAFNSMVNVLRDVSGADRYNVSTALNAEDGSRNSASEYWKRNLPTLEADGKTYNYGELGQLQGFSSMFLMRYGNGILEPIDKYVLEGKDVPYKNGGYDKRTNLSLGTSKKFTVCMEQGSNIASPWPWWPQWTDGYIGTSYIDFAGPYISKDKNCVSFSTDSEAIVKIWWVAGESGRQMAIYDKNGNEVLATNESSAYWHEPFMSTLKLDSKGLYYLSGKGGKNQIYKVEVTELPAKLNRDYGTLFIGNGKFDATGAALTYTQKATKINEGQVTQYPYLVGDLLDTALTHSQWYQLDLEKKSDQSQEVVVWYVLSDGTGSSTSCTTEIAQLYEAMGLDGVNDYYIYSKGNITYSGAGHSAISGDEEQKLFINTIIRAIASGDSIPKASFVNAVLTDAEHHSYTQYVRDESKVMVTLMGSDDDLRAPEHETDYNAGQFKEAFLYWDVDDNQIYTEGVDVKLRTYVANGVGVDPENSLYNMIPRSISLNDYTAAQYRNGSGKSMMDVLASNDVRIGAYVTDSYGAIGTASVKLVLREIFNLN